jgi:hypothetical protein
LEQHGILGICPLVTPVLLIPGHDPGQYLDIRGKYSGMSGNRWNTAVVDSGADVALCSQRYADAHGFGYHSSSPMTINTAGGSRTTTLGTLDEPLEFWLARDTSRACKAEALVQVIAGADHLYDLIISMEIITQWGAYVNPCTSTMFFHPQWWTHRSTANLSQLAVSIARKEKTAPADA